MAQNTQDTQLKELVEKIQQFLSHQVETNSSLNDAAKESLTVAIECIEQAYEIQKKPASKELADIYKSHKQQQSNPTSGGPPQDPTQLLTNIASSIFGQVGGGLMGAAAGATGQQQAQATTTASSQTTASPNVAQPTGPPKQRKRPTDAEKMAAESFKNQGNDCMKQDKFREAYDYYTQAINIDDNNAIYYSNRAAALSKLGDHEAALRDCKESIEIDPMYSKAYGRMGLAYSSLGNHAEAEKAYVKAVELDPTNESYQNNLNIAEERLAEQQGSGAASAAAGGAAAGANVMGMLRTMMNNPQVMSMAMQSLQDPRIQGMFSMGGNAASTGQQTNQDGQQQQRQQSATSAPPNQEAGNQQQQQQQQQQGTAGSQTTTPGAAPPPSFNPAELLNLTSRIAGNANIDLVGAGQQLLSSIQQNNPDLVDNMRRMMSQAFNPNGGPGNGGADQNDRNPPPGYS